MSFIIDLPSLKVAQRVADVLDITKPNYQRVRQILLILLLQKWSFFLFLNSLSTGSKSKLCFLSSTSTDRLFREGHKTL